jgi:hypothetical protein
VALSCVLLATALSAETPQPVIIPMTHPFFSRLDRLEHERLNSPSGAVYAFSCAAPVSDLVRTPTSAFTPVAEANLPFQLGQTGYYLKDLFALIEMTQSGSEVAARFQSKYQSGEIKIEQMTNEGAKKCPKMAAACYLPGTKTMYLDKNSELGALTPILFHEMLHALDQELADTLVKLGTLQSALEKKADAIFQAASERTGTGPLLLGASSFTEQEMEQAVLLKLMADEALEVGRFKTERLAYNGGFQMEKELVQLFPHYYAETTRKLGYRMPNNFSDADLIERYGINPTAAGKFIRGVCIPLPATP